MFWHGIRGDWTQQKCNRSRSFPFLCLQFGTGNQNLWRSSHTVAAGVRRRRSDYSKPLRSKITKSSLRQLSASEDQSRGTGKRMNLRRLDSYHASDSSFDPTHFWETDVDELIRKSCTFTGTLRALSSISCYREPSTDIYVEPLVSISSLLTLHVYGTWEIYCHVLISLWEKFFFFLSYRVKQTLLE
jgi:hypothetical protein